jgi:hypothetical protein
MIIILSGRSHKDPLLFRYIRKYILPSVLLLVVIRILFMMDFRFIRYLAYSGKEVKYKAIESEAKDLPVVFTGAFQRPSLYTFFTGRESIAISSLYSRQTQFDIWQFEKKYHNKPAFICINPRWNSQIYSSDSLQFGGFRTDSLQTVNRIRIYFNLNENTLQAGDSVNLSFSMQNPYDYDIDFGHNKFPVELCMVFLKDKKVSVHKVSLAEPVGIISGGDTLSSNFSAVVPLLPDGNYHFGLSLNTIFGPSLNSHFVKIRINNND